jgi:glycerol-1-phosphate dehydrogenase [NAD(P)+]
LADHLPVLIGDDAIPSLVSFCSERSLRSIALIADDNTFAALGARVDSTLRSAGLDVLTILLHGEDIGADQDSVYRVLWALDGRRRTLIAVGSGTITDVARFVSHRSGSQFISVPTAASVDGFTSIGAPMILDGVKITVNAQGPMAVFADLPTLCAAPPPLVAAGVGDLIAKLTSVADWELGGILWEEPYDGAIAVRARAAAWDCAAHIADIAGRRPSGLRVLMEGLIESGFCMLDFGQTRPASGYEHHISHFWEMMLLRQGRRSVLHGAKVGLGVLISAGLYARVRGIERPELLARLEASRQPAVENEVQTIHRAYGELAEQLIALQKPFLQMSPERFDALKADVWDNWDAIRTVAASVPEAAEIAGWIQSAGGPTRPHEIGITCAEVELASESSHFYRNRFTIKKLSRLLGL